MQGTAQLLSQTLHIGRRQLATKGVMQLEGRTARLQFSDMGEKRGNTDPASQQHVVAGLGMQREQIGRGRDLQLIALLHLLVHKARAAFGR